MKISLIVPLLFLCFLLADGEGKTKTKRQATEIPFILMGAKAIIQNVYKLWDLFLREPSPDIKTALLNDKQRLIISHFITINSRISALEERVESTADTTIVTILQAFPKLLKLELSLHELSSLLSQIQFAEEQLKKYLILGYKNATHETHAENPATEQSSIFPEVDKKEVDPVEEMSNRIAKREADPNWLVEMFTLQDFATWATSHQYNSIPSLLNRMNNLVKTDGTHAGIFQLITEISKEMQSNICNLRQSPHQVLYNLYNTIALADLKANTLLQFSYMLLKMYNKGNFTVEADIARLNYDKMAREKIEVARNTLAEADRSIYRCDPKQHVEGVTYTKLTRLLQGYVENEVNLNPYGTCRENCQYYTLTAYNGCFKNKFCAKQSECRGKVVDCRYVDSDMHICTSSNPERRYEWIEYENGRTLGSKGVCENKNLFAVDSWWRYLFWHCSYCLCLCDDAGAGSDRYFNLREVTSDVEENKVVTGVRIVKHNQIIHIQIQQGVLTPLGVVEKTSLSWKPVDDYTIDDEDVESNVDFHAMSWLERTIDTDEVFGPSEHVVTGLRLRKIGTHLNLEIRVTPINFTTGEVFKSIQSYWIGNDNTDASFDNPRSEISLKDPDIPLRNGPHSLNSKHDQYIQFQPTSFDKDAGQSTVPFLDSQVLTSQGFPLSGIGLIHRGKTGSGGFIAPKLISYDFAPHLKLDQTD